MRWSLKLGDFETCQVCGLRAAGTLLPGQEADCSGAARNEASLALRFTNHKYGYDVLGAVLTARGGPESMRCGPACRSDDELEGCKDNSADA
jgi:hypothetical protein